MENIKCIFYDIVRACIMYLPVMLKIPKQLSYKRTETNVVLVGFYGVLCEVCAYTVTVSYRCST